MERTNKSEPFARNSYDSIRVYDIIHGIDDMIVYTSWRDNHTMKRTVKIEYNVELDLHFFRDGCDEQTDFIYINELLTI